MLRIVTAGKVHYQHFYKKFDHDNIFWKKGVPAYLKSTSNTGYVSKYYQKKSLF